MEQYKRILLKEFDSKQKVITELINLEAILNLPKGTELYLSDIHGEFEAFDYILRTCAGNLNEKINDCINCRRFIIGNHLIRYSKRNFL